MSRRWIGCTLDHHPCRLDGVLPHHFWMNSVLTGLECAGPTGAWQFDPPMAFVFWLFISNVIQILLMPLIMVGQNLQSRHGKARAENDLRVNIRAEKEIEVILRHLEYQNTMLIVMVQKLGIDTTRDRARQP